MRVVSETKRSCNRCRQAHKRCKHVLAKVYVTTRQLAPSKSIIQSRHSPTINHSPLLRSSRLGSSTVRTFLVDIALHSPAVDIVSWISADTGTALACLADIKRCLSRAPFIEHALMTLALSLHDNGSTGRVTEIAFERHKAVATLRMALPGIAGEPELVRLASTLLCINAVRLADSFETFSAHIYGVLSTIQADTTRTVTSTRIPVSDLALQVTQDLKARTLRTANSYMSIGQTRDTFSAEDLGSIKHLERIVYIMIGMQGLGTPSQQEAGPAMYRHLGLYMIIRNSRPEKKTEYEYACEKSVYLALQLVHAAQFLNTSVLDCENHERLLCSVERAAGAQPWLRDIFNRYQEVMTSHLVHADLGRLESQKDLEIQAVPFMP